MTSLTFKYAFKIPTKLPHKAPTNIAWRIQTNQGNFHTSAPYKQAQAPTVYWPAAPMLNKPALYANKI